MAYSSHNIRTITLAGNAASGKITPIAALFDYNDKQ